MLRAIRRASGAPDGLPATRFVDEIEHGFVLAQLFGIGGGHGQRDARSASRHGGTAMMRVPWPRPPLMSSARALCPPVMAR